MQCALGPPWPEAWVLTSQGLPHPSCHDTDFFLTHHQTDE